MSRARSSGPRIARGLTFALASLALLSCLESMVWIGALLAELRPHLFLLVVLTFGAALAQRDRIAAPLGFLTALALAGSLASLYRSVLLTPKAGPLLRVGHVHLAGAPSEALALSRWASELRLDVAAFTGLHQGAAFPEHVSDHRIVHGHGSALFVRSAAQGVRFPKDLGDLTSVSLAAGACQVRVVAMEVPSRFDYAGVVPRAKKIASLQGVKKLVRSVWLGHLGSRAEASDLAPFLAAAELRDSRRSHGLLATAPAALGALGVPLDHVLVHGWLGVRERGVSEAPIAGAHRAVTATLELTEPDCREGRAQGSAAWAGGVL